MDMAHGAIKIKFTAKFSGNVKIERGKKVILMANVAEKTERVRNWRLLWKLHRLIP